MDANTCNLVDVFRDRVTTLRNELKMTQEQFADHCGLTLTDINNLTRKKKIPSEVMVAIADKCDVSTDWLLGRTNIRKTVTDANTAPQDFDYSKVTVGDLNRILAFTAACGKIQIISPYSKGECVSLRVIDKQLSEFLRRLQKKAIDVITDPDETEYLTDWFEKKCANNVYIGNDLPFLLHEEVDMLDKYHGAFPWKYLTSTDHDLEFDFTDAEWKADNPAPNGYLQNPICFEDITDYSPYLCLFDGITGYYDTLSYHEPPHRKNKKTTSTMKDDSANIPNEDDELPFA